MSLQRASGDLRLHRLADGVYVYRGFFSNSAVFVLPRSVLVVDTQVAPEAARRLRAEISRLTPLPIRHVVNTHYHGDHTGGNAYFPEAEILATKQTGRYVHERDEERVEYAHTFGLEIVEVHPIAAPTRTFEGRLDLDIDGERVEVLQLGRAETPDACVVWWPARRALACGDGVASHDYPYLGVPFMDEGLRDDGEWTGYLRQLQALRPSVLVPGHGPPLIGEEAIGRRLELLRALMEDLLNATREELARGGPPEAVAQRVDARLAHYRGRADLRERTVSQRFAIYRCINNLTPERRGRGWWNDLRPSVLPTDLASELSRLESLDDSAAHKAAQLGAVADRLFDASRKIRPFVDATECIAASTRAAKAALRIEPGEPLALLNLGSAEVFGGMVLAQPMSRGIAKLRAALGSGKLGYRQRLKACFFLGKAHQMELREAEADRWFRLLLPPGTRWLFPLLRERIHGYP